VNAARAIVLPGVGHFGAFVAGLRERNLTEPLRVARKSGVPILGICLGLQAMFSSSEEAPEERGLGFFPEKVTALPTNVKSPHIGWNQLRRVRDSRLLCGVPADAYFYFAHSFAAPASAAPTVAACDHGVSFAAVIENENLFGVQFHPEKSGDIGALVLRNFVESLS
jgi:imidazole glycerol-phosphate synthase subunit HisH